MSTLLTMGIIVCLAIIAFQDIRERQVSGYLFPLALILMASRHYLELGNVQLFGGYVLYNVILVSVVLAILYLYTRLIAGIGFLDHSFGLGDLLFFYAFAFGFPTLTFTVLFAHALLFSLLVFFLLKGRALDKTVPLAGLMGIFLVLVFGYVLAFKYPSMYAY